MARSILLFDGFCPLCSKLVHFVARKDRSESIRFAALSSETGKKLLEERGVSARNIDTAVWIDDTGTHFESEAILQIIRNFGLPWNLLRIFCLTPPGWRNRLYRFVAKRRRLWWSRNATCYYPEANLQDRFLP